VLIFIDDFIFESKGDNNLIFSGFGETITKAVLIATEHSGFMENGQSESNQYHMGKLPLRKSNSIVAKKP
jgi:hypothetical protein